MKILIAIHGAHNLPERRIAQRETWIRDLDGSADYRYFLGRPALEEEGVEYIDGDDGPLYLDTSHTFRTLVLHHKTEALAKYGLDHGYDYVFKCDDDTYVHVGNLLASGFAECDYSGYVERLYSFKHGWYGFAHGGSGYWLSRTAMEFIVGSGVTGYPGEDGAVGMTLHRKGIQPVHNPNYLPGITEDQIVKPPKSAITLHKCGPEAMQVVHAAYGGLVVPWMEHVTIPNHVTVPDQEPTEKVDDGLTQPN